MLGERKLLNKECRIRKRIKEISQKSKKKMKTYWKILLGKKKAISNIIKDRKEKKN